jgi:hypothetical protein
VLSLLGHLAAFLTSFLGDGVVVLRPDVVRAGPRFPHSPLPFPAPPCRLPPRFPPPPPPQSAASSSIFLLPLSNPSCCRRIALAVVESLAIVETGRRVVVAVSGWFHGITASLQRPGVVSYWQWG